VLLETLYSGFSGVVGVTLSALTFWLAFVFAKTVWFVAAPSAANRPAQWFAFIVAGLVVTLIFADSLRTRRDEMENIPLWLLREYLHMAPRALSQARRSAVRARGLVRIRVAECSDILADLASRSKAASKVEMAAQFPGIPWPSVLAQISYFEGVLVLRPDRSAVTLTVTLRFELRALLPRRAAPVDVPPEEPEVVPVSEPEKLTPHEVLGVSPRASISEIKVAYRKRVKECHPDRFAMMDATARKMAEQWTKALNAAYESLVTRRPGN
jgi:DnaJ-domain-containing protein 1